MPWQERHVAENLSRVFQSRLPTCKADGTLEGAAHPFEAVLNQVALQLGGGVEGLAAEFALVVQPFICQGKHVSRKGDAHHICARLLSYNSLP